MAGTHPRKGKRTRLRVSSATSTAGAKPYMLKAFVITGAGHGVRASPSPGEQLRRAIGVQSLAEFTTVVSVRIMADFIRNSR